MDPSAQRFEQTGGRLCLDFTNTVSNHLAADPGEKLHRYEDLLAFAEQADALDAQQARVLAEVAAAAPAEAARALEAARAMRGALFRLFRARTEDAPPDPADLDTLNARLSEAMAHRRLVAGGDGLSVEFDPGARDLVAPLWPVAASAAELLTSDRCTRVRVCGAMEAGCTWLFLDESKNQSRRWCSMKGCGNRAKARRHYHRATGRAP